MSAKTAVDKMLVELEELKRALLEVQIKAGAVSVVCINDPEDEATLAPYRRILDQKVCFEIGEPIQPGTT
jgi:hypothetical protein